MKNSFFSKFTPKEPKFFPLLKQLSDVLSASSVLLVESLEHDLPTERADYYKQIKDMEREGDRLTHLIFDELSTTFITPFDREDIHDLASCMDDVIDGINSSAKRIVIYNPRPISESGKELSRLIHEEAINIGKAMDELETFRKNPKPLRNYCTQLHDIENQADDVYELFITKLFEEEKDCIEILKNNGFNIVRLRLYNDPGNPDYSPSNRLPAGISGPEDILRLAKRAKQAGMQILLTFHYSDYWTNGEDQNKPHEWEGLDFEGLKKALYDFTFDFMNKMKAQGTTPEFVALGNETQAGMLYPDGSCDNFVQLSELFNTGYDAVKAVSPDSKVVIHSNAAGDKDQYNWYYGELKNRNTKYDIIGASYYPFWTEKTAGQIREWADYITAKFDKDILIMETGYSWDKTLPDNTPGQLAHNGPYPDFSPLGQKNFMLELIKEIKQAKDCRILGFLYWDPIFIEVEGMGWELGAKNYVSNTTLFDFEGNRLEALDAFKYNN